MATAAPVGQPGASEGAPRASRSWSINVFSCCCSRAIAAASDRTDGTSALRSPITARDRHRRAVISETPLATKRSPAGIYGESPHTGQSGTPNGQRRFRPCRIWPTLSYSGRVAPPIRTTPGCGSGALASSGLCFFCATEVGGQAWTGASRLPRVGRIRRPTHIATGSGRARRSGQARRNGDQLHTAESAGDGAGRLRLLGELAEPGIVEAGHVAGGRQVDLLDRRHAVDEA
jgi:hypothetical protein